MSEPKTRLYGQDLGLNSIQGFAITLPHAIAQALLELLDLVIDEVDIASGGVAGVATTAKGIL